MSATGRSWKGITKMGFDWSINGVGDFDNDGYDDILVVNSFANKLGFFDMNNGTPSWVGLGSFGAGWEVEGMADLDGSGTDDILWRHEDGRMGMYKMNGNVREWESLGFASTDWEIIL